MNLENTFGKVEKPPKEKKLEIITNKEGIIKDLEGYFEKNKYEGIPVLIWEDLMEYFGSCMKFLKSFELSLGIISEFNKKVGSVQEKEAFGLYLSAMIQTSYNKGFNNFTFEEVNADKFGAFIKGRPKNPIRITTKELKGNHSLWYAENCSLTTETLEGYGSFGGTEGCLAEITNYQGRNFGYRMKNCTIKSENKETLETIKKQVGKRVNNRFELKK